MGECISRGTRGSRGHNKIWTQRQRVWGDLLRMSCILIILVDCQENGILGEGVVGELRGLGEGLCGIFIHS